MSNIDEKQIQLKQGFKFTGSTCKTCGFAYSGVVAQLKNNKELSEPQPLKEIILDKINELHDIYSENMQADCKAGFSICYTNCAYNG
jgi:hypothetical protein